MSTLRKRDFCPIHHSLFCCGREQRANRIENNRKFREPRKSSSGHWYVVRPGVWRINDPNYPRGYREKRNKTAMTELLRRKLPEYDNCCGICHERFTDFREVTPDHIEPRGLGGAWRDDHPDNIQPAHASCNTEKGSKRNYQPCPAKPKAEYAVSEAQEEMKDNG